MSSDATHDSQEAVAKQMLCLVLGNKRLARPHGGRAAVKQVDDEDNVGGLQNMKYRRVMEHLPPDASIPRVPTIPVNVLQYLRYPQYLGRNIDIAHLGQMIDSHDS